MDQLLNEVVFAVFRSQERGQRFSPTLEEQVETPDYGLIGEPVSILQLQDFGQRRDPGLGFGSGCFGG